MRVLGLLISWFFVSIAHADSISIDARIGFSGVWTPGRAAPVFVSIESDRTIDANLIVRAAGRTWRARAESTRIAVNPGESKFVVTTRTGPAWDTHVVVLLADRATGRTLAHDVIRPDESQPLAIATRVLVSGDDSVRTNLAAGLSKTAAVDAASISISHLPTDEQAFDAVDVIILADAAIEQIEPETQAAMLAWARRGGRLMVWPGANPLPASSAIVDELPARVGGLRFDDGRPTRELEAKVEFATTFDGGISKSLDAGEIVLTTISPDSPGVLERIVRPASLPIKSAAAEDRPESPGDFRFAMILLFALGVLGGPAESAVRHRMGRPIFSTPALIGWAVTIAAAVAIWQA